MKIVLKPTNGLSRPILHSCPFSTLTVTAMGSSRTRAIRRQPLNKEFRPIAPQPCIRALSLRFALFAA